MVFDHVTITDMLMKVEVFISLCAYFFQKYNCLIYQIQCNSTGTNCKRTISSRIRSTICQTSIGHLRPPKSIWISIRRWSSTFIRANWSPTGTQRGERSCYSSSVRWMTFWIHFSFIQFILTFTLCRRRRLFYWFFEMYYTTIVSI